MIDNPHPAFSPPKANCTIWRYVDFTKLLNILETRTLHFARADQLDDPYEGRLTRAMVSILRDPKRNGGLASDVADQYLKGAETNREHVYINCWYCSEHESAAMWKLYLQSPEGISIRTDHDSLVKALQPSPIWIRTSLVRYVDYETTVVPLSNMLFPFLHKRLSFIHENELRALIWRMEDVNVRQIPPVAKSVSVDIDPKQLIKAVHVAPTAPTWFADLVQAVVRRYGLACDVVRSSLYDRPTY